jgi:predicted porin
MKKLHSAAALGAVALLAGPTLAQQTSVQISGSIRTTVNHIRNGSAYDLNEVRDNSSRLGFRGREDLGGGASALFGLELGLNADDGSLTTPAYRNSYVGLQGGWGTFAMGRLDSGTPVGSPLYSQVVNIINFAPNDGGATAIGTTMLNARNRTSNSLGYKSPTFGGGFDLAARYYWRGAGTATDPEDSTHSLDLGLSYANGPLKAGIGYGSDGRKGGLKTNELNDKWQAGARYTLGMFEPYLLGGVDHYVNTPTSRSNVKFWIAGTKVSMGVHALVFNVMERDVQTALHAQRRRQEISYHYTLSKRTEIQAFIDHDGVDSSKRGVAVLAVGAGIRHDF